MNAARQTDGMTRPMNKSHYRRFAWILSLFAWSITAQAEDVAESLVLQFSKGDLATIEHAVQDTLDSQPVQGESSDPVSSPYAFGTITARGIDYQFAPKIHETRLGQGAIQFKLSLHGFHGFIRRLELNSSGTQVCTNIHITSPRGDIPVSVVVRPRVTATGELELEASESKIDLNEDNFEVAYPEHCSVIFGLNWLIKWTLPWLIQSYKETISSALSDALAKGLRERTSELSPFLSLNVTLPFEGQRIPSFNVAIGVHPHQITISPETFLSSFATSLTIDPDIATGFSHAEPWPKDVSFFGISWDFMNALFREAQAKGVIRSTFRQNHPALGAIINQDLWTKVFPGLPAVIKPNDSLEIDLIGGAFFQWSRDDDFENNAHLNVRNLKLRLRSGSNILADIETDAHATFRIESMKDRLLNARLQSVTFGIPRVVENSGVLANRHSQAGLETMAQLVEQEIQKSPEQARDLFELKLPSMKIGQHEVVINHVQTVAGGIILPLAYQQNF